MASLYDFVRTSSFLGNVSTIFDVAVCLEAHKHLLMDSCRRNGSVKLITTLLWMKITMMVIAIPVLAVCIQIIHVALFTC
jgi:hypothetical protein